MSGQLPMRGPAYSQRPGLHFESQCGRNLLRALCSRKVLLMSISCRRAIVSLGLIRRTELLTERFAPLAPQYGLKWPSAQCMLDPIQKGLVFSISHAVTLQFASSPRFTLSAPELTVKVTGRCCIPRLCSFVHIRSEPCPHT